MKKLIIPSKLNEGDTVAFISISGGRAGDEDMIPRYWLGKRRFEKIFHVKVVETPHALRGSGYLYEHPEKRAEDLMWALKNDSIKGIICNQGGDDSYRVLPYIDPKVIHDHPKVFMGFSDIATWMAVFAYAGVRAYYGHCPGGGKLRGVFHLREEKGETGSGKDRCSGAGKPFVHCPDPL